jgi:adenosylcobinamide kinase/adenosylcobinamide-phosphate guanylyltransferase
MTEPSPEPSFTMPRVTLILGGARSGKSAHAEKLAADYCARHGHGAMYLATAQARDAEMADRIAQHRARRGADWQTIEAPLDIVTTLESAPKGMSILVDCLTLWLANLMETNRDLPHEFKRLTDCLRSVAGPIILVANEVGLGIVPDNQLARRFRDHAGLLNQTVAACADQVLFVAAGLPMRLK